VEENPTLIAARMILNSCRYHLWNLDRLDFCIISRHICTPIATSLPLTTVDITARPLYLTN